MKLAYLLIPVATVMAGLVEQRHKSGCDSDNCARAVTGTRLGAASVSAHVADCSSFMKVTTYVGGSTVKPTHTPTYATACSAAGDSYSSACSCWGIPVQTVVVSPPRYDDNGADDLPNPPKKD